MAANLLDRNFVAHGPNQKWVTDITYIWTWEGWLSRRIVGWVAADHIRTDLPLQALDMALGRRQPGPGVTHHSDRGSQYASGDYTSALSAAGLVCSMSRKGDCWDNAVAESFFSTIKTELLDRTPWPTRAKARTAIAEWIQVF